MVRNKKMKERYSNSPFYKLYTTVHNLFITSKFHPTHIVKICRKTAKISFKSKKKVDQMIQNKKKEEYTILPIYCTFGMINILGKQILLLVTSATVAGHFRGRPILKINEVKGKIVIKAKKAYENGEEMLMIMDYIRKYMKKGFYFSHFYDLTTKFPWSLFQYKKESDITFPKNSWDKEYFNLNTNENDQLQFEPDISKASKGEIDDIFGDFNMEIPLPNKSRPLNSMDPKNYKRDEQFLTKTNPISSTKQPKRYPVLNTKFDNRIESIFAWNLNAISEFHLSTTWNQYMNVFFPPIIQGHVDCIDIKGKMSLLVISRRSYIMGGTRYNSRGINPSGFVGNFVETEQIMDMEQKVYSYIQIRGSVPFFWNQKNVGREVVINQTDEINREIMLKHFVMLRDRFSYKDIVILNLLSKKKKQEVKLGKYLHKLYLDNFSNKQPQKETKKLVKNSSIHESMDVGWLDQMENPPAKENGKRELGQEMNKKKKLSLNLFGKKEKNADEKLTDEILNNQRRRIETYREGDSLAGIKFETTFKDDMNIYIQHIDFHSIGNGNVTISEGARLHRNKQIYV
jgi:hypothetical protein